MPIRILALLTAGILAAADGAPVARAEAWPDLGEFVPVCPLIVHVRSVPEEAKPDRAYTVCSVVEVVRGEYSPLAFAHKPPTGCVILPGTYPARQAGEALDLIAFYGRNSVDRKGFLHDPDMTLVVDGDTVTYPPRGELGESQSMALADFKQHLRAIASDVTAAAAAVATAPPRPARIAAERRDLEGTWRMFLPAGFEHTVTLTRIEGDRYRLEPANLASAGVYELQGDDLVLIESPVALPGAYRWRMHSRHLLSLIEQTHEPGASYIGATLFRSNGRQQ